MKAFLHLDIDFQPFEQGLKFDHFTFSGGELHVRITDNLKDIQQVCITSRPTSFNDIGSILLAADVLKRAGVQNLELFIPYFPAARQDRVMVPGEPLSVKVYADLINGVGFNKVTLFDSHSDVTPALIDNVEVISNYAFIQEVVKQREHYHLVSPDGGALKKVYKLSQMISPDTVVECSKVRNVKTGKLEAFKVYADDLKGMDCIVVDDICDGGGTFLGLADELKRKNAGKLILAVSHGIFSKGTEIIKEKYDQIYCTDAFPGKHEGVEVIKIENLIKGEVLGNTID